MVLGVLLVNLAIGAKVYSESDANSSANDPHANLDLFVNVLERIRRDYVDGGELTYEDLVHGALRGMIGMLDPHSEFMPPTRYSHLMDDTEGRFGGVGVHINIQDGYLTVLAPMEDTPAYEAGIMSGDRIVKIEGKNARNISMPEAVDKLRGKPGSKVKMTFFRPSTREDIEVTLKRALIKVATVKDINNQRKFTVDENKIGYVRLTQFGEATSRDLEEALRKLELEDMKGLVLDLRHNGGGILQEAIKLTGLFIEEGPVVQVRDYRGRRRVMSDTDSRITYNGPLIVAVSHMSASASEIVAAALQDHGRAIVVGGKMTHGKGTVQQIMPLNRAFIANLNKDSGQLKFTISKFYRINGATTQRDGVKPDIVLPSVLDYLGMSEAELPRALESDEIDKAEYKPLNRVEAFFTSLRKASTKRINGDQDYKYIKEDIVRAKKQKEDRSISLNEKERRKERAVTKSRIEARNKERAKRGARSEKYFEIDVKIAGANKPLKNLNTPKPRKENPDPNAIPEDDSGTFRFDPELRETLQILSDFVKLNSKLISQIERN